MKTLRFFKINDGINAGWYADVEGHTLADNQMVAGSDKFLEELDRMTGHRGELSLTISTTLEAGTPAPVAELNIFSHNQWGATYTLSGPAAERYNAVGFKLWICNVTHDVLGEHPRSIYIYGMN